MKVEMKLYKSFDADFIALNENGISVPKLMKTALEGYVRGKKPNIYISESKDFSLEGKKRYMHIAMYVDDEKTIEFLKTKIKYRQRSAFIKTLTRSCIITPQVGVYFNNKETIDSQTRLNNEINLENYNNLYIANFDNTIKEVINENHTDQDCTETTKQNQTNENKTTDSIIQKDNDKEIFEDVIDINELNDFKLDDELLDEIEEIKENNDINDDKTKEENNNLDEDSLFNQFLNMRS